VIFFVQKIVTDLTFPLFSFFPQNGSTPFHWAAANCHLEVVQALRTGQANIDAPDKVRHAFLT